MTKTKFGVNPAFYAVIAFFLAWTGDIIWIGALILFLIAAEQNEWAARQAMQALVISIVFGVLLNLVSMGMMSTYQEKEIMETIAKIVNGFLGVIEFILKALRLALCIWGIVKVAGGKEAKLPLANKFSDWAYGKVAPKAAAKEPEQPQQ